MKKPPLLSAAIALALTSTSAFATNGMLLEGYGARATALGGAGVAIDNGNSNVLTNPANLSMMQEGSARLGVGLRMLGPDVSTYNGPFTADSDGTAYFMPSVSYMRKSNGLTYGVAMLAQGGMGTEYGSNSWISGLSGQENRSELGVGALMFPISKQINDRLRVGAALDFVWSMLDLRMDMAPAQMASLAAGNGGYLRVNGGPPPGALGTATYGRFDFSDDSDFTGQAKATGWAGQFGFSFDASDSVTIGASYRTKTHLDDMTSDASVTFGGFGPAGIHSGKVKVVDFQFPEQFSLGASVKANDRLTLVGEVKYIGWSDVMDTFKMQFTANSGAFAGSVFDLGMDQKWDDQTVFSIGAEYQATPKLALRVGANIADNPIPNANMTALFPATIENHFTGGFGYRIDDQNKIGMSFTYAPEVDVTGSGFLNTGVRNTHSQFNWSANYVYTF